MNLLLILFIINCPQCDYPRISFETAAINYAKIINPTIGDDRLGRIDDDIDDPLSLVRCVWYTAMSFNLSPEWMWAMMRAESDYINIPLHDDGLSVGYMAIQPKTASWLMGYKISKETLLWDFKMNIGLSAKYLRYLKDYYGKQKNKGDLNSLELATISYQYGQSGARKLFKKYNKGKPFKTKYLLKIEKIYNYLLKESDKYYNDLIGEVK